MKTVVNELIAQQLLRLQNQDGGWGWGIGKSSNVEATAYALMGLSQPHVQLSSQRQLERGWRWLLGMQLANGAWPYASTPQTGSWVTSLAMIALSDSPRYQQSALQGAKWLLKQKGERLGFLPSLMYRLGDKKQAGKMNPDLQGWAWTPRTASWVEPTAYALLALRKFRPLLDQKLSDERVRQGEALLYNRMCVDGGWNYGNAVVLKEQLPPYPDTTAISLIALQHHADKHENQLSLHVLNKLVEQQKSGLILSWAIICRSLYGQSSAGLQNQLMEQYHKAGFLGQSKLLALALIALGNPADFFEV